MFFGGWKIASGTVPITSDDENRFQNCKELGGSSGLFRHICPDAFKTAPQKKTSGILCVFLVVAASSVNIGLAFKCIHYSFPSHINKNILACRPACRTRVPNAAFCVLRGGAPTVGMFLVLSPPTLHLCGVSVGCGL